MTSIAFGASGWRGVIAEDFTFTALRALSQAVGDSVRSQGPDAATRGVVIGYDTRFLSEAFAAQSARVLAAQGVRALLCDRDAPAALVAHEVLRRRAAAGIVVTAGHNAPEYNGIKLATAWGGPAAPDATGKIQARANQILNGQRVAEMPSGEAETLGLIERINPREGYLERLRNLVDLSAIREAHLRVVVDPLYGCAQGYLDATLRDAGCDVRVLHDWRDPNFGGHAPDPAEGRLHELAFQVVENSAHLGLATDGGAGRFGLVDADGSFIQPNHFLGLLLRHLVKGRGWTGGVARSVATSHLVDAVARRFGLPVHETPVGFAAIGELLAKDALVVGGEESGGLSIQGHVPEKDGILACLLAAEMVAFAGGARLRTLLHELLADVGPFFAMRRNYRLGRTAMDGLLGRLAHPPAGVAGLAVIDATRLDGVKLILEDGSWLLFRVATTEPAVRLYVEAATQAQAHQLVAAGEALIGS